MPRRASAALRVFGLAPYVGQLPAPAWPAGPARAGREHQVMERGIGVSGTGAVPPRRGWARPNAGRAPRLPAVPVFRGSTGQVQGLYPWLYGASMPPAGAGRPGPDGRPR